MSEARGTKRYALTLTKVPYEARDEFRRLSMPETYFEVRPGEVGERVAYSVSMTPEEYERARRVAEDPASNLQIIEEVGRATPDSVPGAPARSFLAMDGMNAVGLNGRGVSVGVLDSALSHGADGFFSGRIKATKGYYLAGDTVLENDGYSSWADDHGTKMSSLALPPAGRLVFGGSVTYDWDALTRAMYWMVDEIGVDVVNMSFSGPERKAVFADALNHASSKNVLLFASRGNEGNSTYLFPAGDPNAMAISAYDTGTGRISDYSSYGNVFAASVGDAVTWITRNGSEETTSNTGGTSAASALATRMAAALLTGGRSKGNVRAYMARTARRTGSPHKQGAGILQGSAAVAARKADKPYRRNLTPRYQGKAGHPLEGVLVNRETGEPLPGGKYADRIGELDDPTAPVYGGRRPGMLVDAFGNRLPTQPGCEV